MVCLILQIWCDKMITPSFLSWAVIVLKILCNIRLKPRFTLWEYVVDINTTIQSKLITWLHELILDMNKMCKTGMLHYPNQFNFIVENEFMIIYHRIVMHLTLLNWSKSKLYTIDLNLGSLCRWKKIIALVKIIKWLHTALWIEWTLSQCY